MNYWVSLPYATYGIRVEQGRVVNAAPIARWMIGKDSKQCFEWITKKGGTYEQLKEN